MKREIIQDLLRDGISMSFEQKYSKACQGRSFIGKAYFPLSDHARREPKTIRNAKEFAANK